VKEWMPNNPVLRFLTPPLRDLLTYPVKMDSEYIYINVQGIKSGNSAEIVFGGATQAGKTASDVSVDEVLLKDLGFLPFSFLLKNLCCYMLCLLLCCTSNRVALLALQNTCAKPYSALLSNPFPLQMEWNASVNFAISLQEVVDLFVFQTIFSQLLQAM
jgi:hypothetical protein